MAQGGIQAASQERLASDALHGLVQALTYIDNAFSMLVREVDPAWSQATRLRLCARLKLLIYASEALVDEIRPLVDRWDSQS